MPSNLKVRVEGRDRIEKLLDAMDPEKRSAVVSASLRQLGDRLVTIMRERHLSGPAPHKLERRTGETYRSVDVDRGGLSRGFIRVGTPGEKWWLENYETGSGVRGNRPFAAPAISDLSPEIEEVFFRNWEREIARV